MREPVRECHSFGVMACSGNRPSRHMGEEGGSCDSKASFFSTAKNTFNCHE